MNLIPYGAAGVVTGSAYLLELEHARILIDFGMFQGDRELEAMNIVPEGLHARDLDAVILTHGHLDHCGRLPMLVRRGYRGSIFTTAATIEMAELVLRDAAHIMEADYERKLRKAQKKGMKVNRDDAPLFDADDVADTIKLMRAVDYDTLLDVAPGVAARFLDAGHMLGSASIELRVMDQGTTRRIVFSGDIGPHGLPFLRDPNPPEPADVVVMESTYGDRNHRSLADTLAEFSRIVQQAVAQNGKIFVPSFAIGRTQQLLYHLAELFKQKVIPAIPIYIDSPMGINATRIYQHHTELFDDESTALLRSGELLSLLTSVHTTETREESQAINDVKGPIVVIAGSGMATAGRILHHLRQNLDDPTAHVIIVGYQGHGTLGRKLVDGQQVVSVLGDKISVRAQIHTLGGFSAHAGQTELIDWGRHCIGPTTSVYLTHGEDDARTVLAERLQETTGVVPYLPTYAERLIV
ncbi:MAG: MBL fold metallo-hydrolase [Candidatus Kapabacteria bacterium]|nr:MBL fold metallo-hydrolase [Candidatus Kapabacteria bacterium]